MSGSLPIEEPPFVSLDAVAVTFRHGVRALDDVTLQLRRGDILGLVGESGSGKTTLCRVLVGLTLPDKGTVEIGGHSVDELLRKDRLAFRRRIQMLLQDAVASLSPRMTVGELLDEPMLIHGLPRGATRERLQSMLRTLGLPPDIGSRYPHEISGGQARRVGIARALLLQPEILVADEPTAGLDLSVQGEVLNLLLDLQAQLSLTSIFVSHNLDVVRRVTTRMAVMYLGQIVEEAPTAALFARAAHPYARRSAVDDTRAGARATPATDRAAGRNPERRRSTLRLQVPHPLSGGAASLCRGDAAAPRSRARSQGPLPLSLCARPSGMTKRRAIGASDRS